MILFLRTFLTPWLLLSAASIYAQTAADAERICNPMLIHGVNQRYLESNRLFTEKIRSMMCSDRQLTAEKAKAQGFDIGVVIEEIPIEAMWSNDESERMKARDKLCKSDFQDVKDVSLYKLMEKEPVAELLKEFNICVGNVANAKGPLLCNVTAGDPDHATLHITYHPTMNVPTPLVSVARVVGGYVENGQVAKDYATGLKMWEAARIVKPSAAPPAPPSSDTFLPVGAPIRVGSTFITFTRQEGKALEAYLNTDTGLSCQYKVDPVDRVAFDVTITPHGENTVIGQKTVQLRDNDGCSADGSVLHERQFCADTSAGATLEKFSHSVASSGSPRDASFIERIDMKSDCINVFYRLKGAGLDWLRTCKGSAWLAANFTLEQRVPSGAVRALTAQQFNETVSSMAGGCSVPFQFTAQIPSDVRVRNWTWQAKISSLEREVQASGMSSLVKKIYTISNANASTQEFVGSLSSSTPHTATLVITRAGDRCGGGQTHTLPSNASANALERYLARIHQLINPGRRDFEKDINRLRTDHLKIERSRTR